MTELNNTNEISLNNITDINIKELIPNVIDNVIVTIRDNHHAIFIPTNMPGMELRAWYKGPGGIFSKDIKNYTLGNSTGQYIIIKNNELNCIARLINEDEEELFNTLNLNHGKIKDKSYMILKCINENEKINSLQEYLININMNIEEESLIIESEVLPEDDGLKEKEFKSVELFNE
ncbi:hypothetical protein M0Q50_06400 [bacterium]|jgi:hypothetical protein|nr:hypothetical protein [bacterium]